MSWTSRVGLLLLVALGMLSGSTAMAGNFGAFAGISTISPCPSFCGGSGTHTDFSADGGEGFANAATDINNVEGSGTAAASLTGSTLLPVLGVLADSNPNARVTSQGVGYNAYTFTSTTAATISLNVVLEGSATAAAVNDASGRASVAVIKGDDLPFSTSYGTLVFEIVPGSPELELLGTVELFLPVNVGNTTVTGNIPINLAPGDKFFVWASLSGSGVREGIVDADNTLTMQFSDASGINPVPEPATAWLLLLSIGCVLLRRSKLSSVASH